MASRPKIKGDKKQQQILEIKRKKDKMQQQHLCGPKSRIAGDGEIFRNWVYWVEVGVVLGRQPERWLASYSSLALAVKLPGALIRPN